MEYSLYACGKRYRPVSKKEKARRLEVRFWARVDCSGGPDACWPWGGMRDKRGYGQVRYDGRPTTSTRASLLYSGIPRPSADHFALHSCDNPNCCNPAHLRWGTPLENAADREERTYGRSLKDREKLKARAIELFDQGVPMRTIAIQIGVAQPGDRSAAGRVSHMLAEHRGKKDREKLLQSVG